MKYMERKYWHPAYCGAAGWEFKQNRGDLEFIPEHQLSKEPLRIDLLIIRKRKNTEIVNEIGKIFRHHNLFEFKSPGDGLTIDDYYKVMGYACQYKALGRHVNEIRAEEMTVTFIREGYPRELFHTLENAGIMAEERYPGIYYLSGRTIFRTQIVVTEQLDPEKHAGIRILSRNADEQEKRLGML